MDIQHHIDDVQLNTFTITFDDGGQYVAFENDYDYRVIESLRSQLQQSEARVKDLLDFVETAREILDQYADADCGQDGYEPNTEMRALVEADRLLTPPHRR